MFCAKINFMLDVFLDALIDSLKILPVLFVVHLLIALLEGKAYGKLKSGILRGRLSPLIGTAVGVIPQCGFSVAATDLYAKKYIPLGTLLSVYIATSDEALPILISEPQAFSKIWPLLLIKVIYALIVGFAVNFFLRKRELKTKIEEQVVLEGCHHHCIENTEDCLNTSDNTQKKPYSKIKKYLLHPLWHSLTVFIFILAVNILIGIIIFWLGEAALAEFMSKLGLLQPFLAGLVGMIPNCAASVAITQMYALGHLSLGATVAGLSVGAGLGFAVLFKENKNFKENLIIIIGLYLLSSIIGVVITLLGF